MYLFVNMSGQDEAIFVSLAQSPPGKEQLPATNVALENTLTLPEWALAFSNFSAVSSLSMQIV